MTLIDRNGRLLAWPDPHNPPGWVDAWNGTYASAEEVLGEMASWTASEDERILIYGDGPVDEAEAARRREGGDSDIRFLVTVRCHTRTQAEKVMSERLGYDDDYGFDYTLDWRNA